MISFRQRGSSDRHLAAVRFPRISEVKPRRNFISRYSHISKNYKKRYIEESRYTEIERENRMLLEKIHKIIKKPFDISHRKANASGRNSKIKHRNFNERKDELPNESFFENKAEYASNDSAQDGPALVIDKKKVINGRSFRVKILEFGDVVKVMASDKEDNYRLIVNSADLFPEFAVRGDWEGILDCIYMEDEQLVLCLRPFRD